MAGIAGNGLIDFYHPKSVNMKLLKRPISKVNQDFRKVLMTPEASNLIGKEL